MSNFETKMFFSKLAMRSVGYSDPFKEWLEDPNNLAEVETIIDEHSRELFKVTRPGFYKINRYDSVVFSKKGKFVAKDVINSRYGSFRISALFQSIRDDGVEWPTRYIGGEYSQASVYPTVDILHYFGLDKRKVPKHIRKVIKFISEGIKDISDLNEFPESTLSFNGHVPILITNNNKSYVIRGNDLIKHKLFEKMNNAYDIIDHLYSKHPNFEFDGEEDPPVRVAFFKDGKVSYSEKLFNKLFKYVKSLPRPLQTDKAKLRTFVLDFFGLMSPDDFKERFNEYMRKKGFGCFKAENVIPGIHIGHYYSHDYYEEHTEVEETYDAGYHIDVSYNGELIIGFGSNIGGFLFVNDEGERIRLVHSAWCQHVSSWSTYSADTTDQLYSQWEISDWLSGPYAERFSLKIEEAPAVFMGNTFRTEHRHKVDAIEALRARMRAM